jgi:hypothetical protein
MGWVVRDSNPCSGKIFSDLRNFHAVSGAHPTSYSMGTGVVSRGLGARMLLSIHFHIVPRLRMSGATPLLPLYAFKAWTEITLHFFFALARESYTV